MGIQDLDLEIFTKACVIIVYWSIVSLNEGGTGDGLSALINHSALNIRRLLAATPTDPPPSTEPPQRMSV